MTCDKCHKPIEPEEPRYTAIEAKGFFRHQACHTTAPSYSIPPAAESIQCSLELGLLIPDGNGGYKAGPSRGKRHEQRFSEFEATQVIKAFWPDMPMGTGLLEIIARAELAGRALKMVEAQVPKGV